MYFDSEVDDKALKNNYIYEINSQIIAKIVVFRI